MVPAMTLARTWLRLSAVIFFGFGAWLTVCPEALESLQVTTRGPVGAVELRAFYGGLELGIGAFLLLASRRRTWVEPALWLAALSMGGLALVRGVAMLGTGTYTPLLAAVLASEILFTVGCALAIASHRGDPEPR